MKIVTAVAGAVALSALLAAPAHTQELQPGLWRGEMTPPGADPLPVVVQVSQRDGALFLVMSNPDLGPMVFSEPVLNGDELTFWWNVGVRIDCTLARQDDGSFEGPCVDDGPAAGEGRLTMSPPEPPEPL